MKFNLSFHLHTYYFMGLIIPIVIGSVLITSYLTVAEYNLTDDLREKLWQLNYLPTTTYFTYFFCLTYRIIMIQPL